MRGVAEQGGQFIHSDVGFNADALSWYAADGALRLMSGRPANQMVPPGHPTSCGATRRQRSKRTRPSRS